MAQTITQRYVVAIKNQTVTWKWSSIFSKDSFPRGVKLGSIKWTPNAQNDVLSINNKVATGITGNIVAAIVAANTNEVITAVNAFKMPVLDFAACTFTGTNNKIEFEFIFPTETKDMGKKISKHRLP